MLITPNMGKMARAFYVVAGVALVVVSLALALEVWQRLAVASAGVISIVAGAVGW